MQKRFIFLVLTLVFSLCFSFFLIHMTPGDPIDLLIGEDASPVQKAELRKTLHLDQPLLSQFWQYGVRMIQGDFGFSLRFQQPISSLVMTRFSYTLFLASVSFLFTIVMGFVLGILATRLKHPLIRFGFLTASVVGYATPNFLLGPVLVLLLAIQLPLFPVSGTGSVSHVVLPALTLALSLCAFLSRMTYVTITKELQQTYCQVARSKGASPFRIMTLHALQNAALPLLNIMGLQFAALLTGTVVTETIFDWPGLGSLFFAAIEKRDYPLIQALVFLSTATFSLMNFGIDLLHGICDPRLRSLTDERSA